MDASILLDNEVVLLQEEGDDLDHIPTLSSAKQSLSPRDHGRDTWVLLRRSQIPLPVLNFTPTARPSTWQRDIYSSPTPKDPTVEKECLISPLLHHLHTLVHLHVRTCPALLCVMPLPLTWVCPVLQAEIPSTLPSPTHLVLTIPPEALGTRIGAMSPLPAQLTLLFPPPPVPLDLTHTPLPTTIPPPLSPILHKHHLDTCQDMTGLHHKTAHRTHHSHPPQPHLLHIHQAQVLEFHKHLIHLALLPHLVLLWVHMIATMVIAQST